mmetsp:Transcript_110701/g.220074  ORF Transcript_110701/g.220074 Transcript_110701/m.220074 type:complete len:203 (+) Transcript_110701:358-966(+)
MRAFSLPRWTTYLPDVAPGQLSGCLVPMLIMCGRPGANLLSSKVRMGRHRQCQHCIQPMDATRKMLSRAETLQPSGTKARTRSEQQTATSQLKVNGPTRVAPSQDHQIPWDQILMPSTEARLLLNGTRGLAISALGSGLSAPSHWTWTCSHQTPRGGACRIHTSVWTQPLVLQVTSGTCASSWISHFVVITAGIRSTKPAQR